MKLIILIFTVVFISACTTDDTPNNSSFIIDADAILFNNNLPADGCSERITIVDTKGDEVKTVLPTDATKLLFKNLLDGEIEKIPEGTYSGNLQIPVKLKYKETKEKGELICGWNQKSTVEQIDIISITKK
jgi:hypothetical protein